MAENTRGSNGKFAKRAAGAAGSAGGNPLTGDGAFEQNHGGATIVDPASVAEPAGGSEAGVSGEPKRPRGRPKGFKVNSGGTTEENKTLDLTALNSILFSCHQLLAAVTATPEIAISEEESTKLAQASANVARHYNITASQKALDWGNFAFALGAIYGPRLYVISQKGKQQEQAAQQQRRAEPGQHLGGIDLTAVG